MGLSQFNERQRKTLLTSLSDTRAAYFRAEDRWASFSREHNICKICGERPRMDKAGGRCYECHAKITTDLADDAERATA
jgi:hypothetical protein